MPSPTPELLNSKDPEQELRELGFARSEKVVLVVDLVESVRSMEENEALALKRWRLFLTRVTGSVLPRTQGHLVKSMGDGLIAQFDSAQQAVDAAQDMHRAATAIELDSAEGSKTPFALRAGVHLATVYGDGFDIYGTGVNLVARIATHAQPCETVITSEVRNQIAEPVNEQILDMGECHLKHISTAVRLWRICPERPTGGAAVLVTGAEPVTQAATEPTLPRIAVLCFAVSDLGWENTSFAQLIAEGISANLARNRWIRVTSARSLENLGPADASQLRGMGVDFVVSGNLRLSGNQVFGSYSMVNLRTGNALFEDQYQIAKPDLLQGHSGLSLKVAQHAMRELHEHVVAEASLCAAPTLPAYALLLGGIRMVHSPAQEAMPIAGRLFSSLVERHPRSAAAQVWFSIWQALAVIQGIQPNSQTAAHTALQALDQIQMAGAQEGLALATRGYVTGLLQRQYGLADALLNEAVAINASEPLSWLFRSVVKTLSLQHDQAVASYEEAIANSPTDPLRYWFMSVGASVYLGANQHQRCIELAQISWAMNRMHAHTARILAIAHVELGQLAQARLHLQQALSLQPSLSLKSYRSSAAKDDPIRERYAKALAIAGLR